MRSSSTAPPRSTRPYRSTKLAAPRVAAPGHDRWLLRTVTSLLVVAVLAIAAVIFYEMNTAGTIYAGVRLGGVDVGGLSRQEALQRLRAAALAPIVAPIVVRAAGEQWEAPALRLGAMLDVPASVDAAFRLGRGGDSFQRLREQFSLLAVGRALQLRTTYRRAALHSYVAELAALIDRPPQSASLTVTPSGTVLQPGRDGLRLNIRESMRLLGAALQSGAPATLDLPVSTTVGALADARARGIALTVTRILDARIRIGVPGHSWLLARADLARMLRVDRARVGHTVSFALHIDRSAVTAYVWPRAASLARPGVDARIAIAISGAAVTVMPGRDGRVVDAGAAVALLSAAIRRGGDVSVAPVVFVVMPIVNGPTVTNEEAAAVAARLRRTLRPTVVWLPRRHWAIAPKAIAAALSLRRMPAITGARLVARLDVAAIAAQLPGSSALAWAPPRNAAVVKRGGRFVVIPAVSGTRPNYAALAAEMLASPTPPDRAVYHLPIASIPPTLGTDAS